MAGDFFEAPRPDAHVTLPPAVGNPGTVCFGVVGMVQAEKLKIYGSFMVVLMVFMMVFMVVLWDTMGTSWGYH